MSRLCMPIGSPVPPGQNNRNLLAAQGSFTVTGQAANLIYTPVASSTTWPESVNDARFASNVNTAFPIYPAANGTVVANKDFQLGVLQGSDQGQVAIGEAGYSVINCRFLDVREGPRVSGSNILIDGCYIRIAAVGSDHGDGIQCYHATSGADTFSCNNIVIRNTKIEMLPGSNNSGIFAADRAGVNITLQNVKVIGGATCGNGACYLVNGTGDTGVRSVNYDNVDFDFINRGFAGISNAGGGLPTLGTWANVRVAGVLQARPY